MEMEMRANQDVSLGTDVTPPLPPFASSLYDSHLSSFCSSCFSPLQSTPFLPNSSFSSHRTPNSLFYCSSQCFSSDSPLHFSSAENHFLSTSHGGDTSDLRLALRLLLIFTDYPQHQHRIRGLLTNRDKLMSPENSDDEEISRRIRDGAKAMATARRMRDGEGFNVEGEDAAAEEAVLCLVLTNAVEVQVDGGQTIGLAVYDTAFSWINHSCSPSACYRFLTSVSSAWPSFSGQSRLQIIPGGGDCHIDTQIGNGVCCKTKFTKGYHASGPRIVVRSIKAIQKGDEVTVAYTDLLQPKSMRQSELWLKYRFICCCSRCSMMPPTYADCALQEILAASIRSTNLSSDQNSCRDKAIEKMTDYIDDTISEFVSLEDPKSCCERLESVLSQGFLYEESDKEGRSVSKIWLQPLHHLSLNAYTTLASAYKIRSSRLLAFHHATNTHQLEALGMSRTGAAYSLMLAGATHHLYMSEPCLIASAAIFWSNVGESLLSLARSSVWNSFVKQRSFPSLKCCKCSLMGKFKTIFSCSLDQNAGSEDLSREFLDCITNIMPKVWSFLKCNCHYLKLVKDPIDLNWLRTMKAWDMLELQAPLGATDVNSCCGEDESIFRCESLDESPKFPMAEEKHHHKLFHHKDEDKPVEAVVYSETAYTDGPGSYSETSEFVAAGVDYKKEEKHHKHLEHLGEAGVAAAGAYALHEKHKEKKDPEHAHRHKIEEEIAAAAAVGAGGLTFHEHHEKKEAKEEEKEAGGKKHHHIF